LDAREGQDNQHYIEGRMTERDVQIFEAWLRGASLGEIAKRFNMDKQQVKKVISRGQKERGRTAPEVVQ